MSSASASGLTICQPENDHSKWYVVYTWPRHEKKVAQHFEERGISHFFLFKHRCISGTRRARPFRSLYSLDMCLCKHLVATVTCL